MKKWLYPSLALLIALLLLPPAGLPEARAEGRMVLAFYYGWFNQSTWSDSRLADKPAELYSSGDRGAMARQIGQAQSAGIDGFVMSWYGPSEGSTTGALTGLLDQAGAQGFKVAADIDLGGGWMTTPAQVVEALRALLGDLANRPAYLRFAGKPVVFFWNQGRFTKAQWDDIRAQADPGHGAIWIAEGASALDYVGAFDGMHNYSIAWSADPAGTNATWAARAAGAGAYFAATAMPGFDDTRMGRGAAATLRARQDGAYFRASFTGAAAANPHMIVITSWNEYFENSHIEPSQAYGVFYLDLARELIGAYKAGGAAPSAPGAPAQSAPAPAAGAGGLVAIPTVSLLNVRQSPTTASPILGGVSAGSRYPILGRSADNAWWLVQYAEGAQGWIYAAYARTEGGDTGVVEVTGADGSAAPAGSSAAPAAPAAASPIPSSDIVAIPLAAVAVRQTPAHAAAALATVQTGMRYPIVGKDASGKWWRIDFGGGQGWIYAGGAAYEYQNGRSLETVPVTDAAGVLSAAAAGGEASAPAAVPAASGSGATDGIFAIPSVAGLNVHAEASNASTVVAQLQLDNRYPIIGKSADGRWWKLDYGGGQGWIYAPAARYEFSNHRGLDAVPVVE
ncbi:MAG: SH3 domain-containing protein [Anaerolineae bacterium]|nr:SH3 domain-containing protein [Anaerolineae bacterium]